MRNFLEGSGCHFNPKSPLAVPKRSEIETLSSAAATEFETNRTDADQSILANNS
jgi:hypothetical protein